MPYRWQQVDWPEFSYQTKDLTDHLLAFAASIALILSRRIHGGGGEMATAHFSSTFRRM